MKWGKKIFPTYNKSFETYIKEKAYSFLILENHTDLKEWGAANEQIKSRQAINFWMGFKSQNFRTTPMDYCAHEDNQNMMGVILGTRMTLSEKPTTITEYCSQADQLIFSARTTAHKWISNGKMVRINEAGGMCPISKEDLNEYDVIKTIDSLQMVNWLLHKDIGYNFKINKPTVIIENANYTPKELFQTLVVDLDFKADDIQIINNFKERTILFKEGDYYQFFETGIRNGLKYIAVETTAQDAKQISGIKAILEQVTKIEKSELTVYIKTQYPKSFFATKSEYITIIYL